MFAPLRFIASYFKTGKEVIDSHIFRLHYQLTFVILMTGSVAITMTQFVGEPIHCIFDGLPAKFADTFCWIHSTFTIPRMPNPGNFPHVGIMTIPVDASKDDVIHHKYYQWVCFGLFAQAVAFYIPRYLWKSAVGGKVRMLLQDLPSMELSTDSKKEQQTLIAARYLWTHRKNFTGLYLKYMGCQVLNLANTIGQMFFINKFLGGQFMAYGVDIFSVSESENREDPMSVVFPKMTKCTFHKFGPSGTIEVKDGFCVLPLNMLNEKIYIFLWFWLIALAVVTVIGLCYDTYKLVTPSVPKLDKRLNAGVGFVFDMLGKNLDEDTTEMIRMDLTRMAANGTTKHTLTAPV